VKSRGKEETERGAEAAPVEVIETPIVPFGRIVGHGGAVGLLQSYLQRTALPPALLFTGSEGIGKATLARTFAAAIFCANAAPVDDLVEPCGVCSSCRKIIRATHADLLWISPEEEAREIRIDAVRKVQERTVFRPVEAPKIVVIIDTADTLNPSAANRLLKTLEEPPPYLLFLLVTSRPDALPDTVRSRCQTIRFHAPALSQIETLLVQMRGWSVADARLVAAMSGGRLGAALASTPDAARGEEAELHVLVAEETLADYGALLAVSRRYAESAEVMRQGLHYLAGWLRDMLVLQAMAVAPAASWLVYSWRYDEIKSWAEKIEPQAVGRLLARITEIERDQTRNINNQLALETLLMTLRDHLIGVAA